MQWSPPPSTRPELWLHRRETLLLLRKWLVQPMLVPLQPRAQHPSMLSAGDLGLGQMRRRPCRASPRRFLSGCRSRCHSRFGSQTSTVQVAAKGPS